MINWDNRLIVIKGAKGVGKTTMLLQHIKRTFPDREKALYVTLDHIWFANHTILDLAEYHYTHGGTHLFLDEVHKYKGWQQEIKNIYDSYPQLHVVVTGSSMLKLEESLLADLHAVPAHVGDEHGVELAHVCNAMLNKGNKTAQHPIFRNAGQQYRIPQTRSVYR